MANNAKYRWGGLIQRKEVYRLSLRGWFVFLLLAVVVGVVAVFGVAPFLSVTVRPAPDVLVIEGWIPDYALLASWEEFKKGGYSTVLTVGGPLRSGVELDPEDTYADVAATSLKRMVGQGIPVQVVRCPLEKRDRTFTCAVTIKAWLEQHRRAAKSVTVATLGPHARRSRLLFEKAFGSGVPIGVIAIKDTDYDARHWWKYSEGVKEMISEASAYFYVRLFFHPFG